MTVDLVAVSDEWMRDAACTGVGLHAMYPDGNDQDAVRMAKRVCAPCPVRVECLDYAMATEVDRYRYGIWGGTSPSQRKEMRSGKGRNRPAEAIRHGTPAGARAHYRRKEPLCDPCRRAAQLETAQKRAAS